MRLARNRLNAGGLGGRAAASGNRLERCFGRDESRNQHATSETTRSEQADSKGRHTRLDTPSIDSGARTVRTPGGVDVGIVVTDHDGPTRSRSCVAGESLVRFRRQFGRDDLRDQFVESKRAVGGDWRIASMLRPSVHRT